MHQEPDVDDRAAYTARQLQLRGLVVLEAGADGAPLRVQRSEDARSASPHELRLDGCGLAECPVLEGEAHLQLLSLRGNRFAAAPAPGTCVAAALCVLDASHNAIADVAPLRGVAGLRALMLAHNAVADLRPLQHLARLELLDVAHNALTSLRGLEPLRRLRVLRAGHNPVASLPSLTGLTRLTELSLSSCPLVGLTCEPEGCGGGGGGRGGTQQEPRRALPPGLRRLSLARCALPVAATCAPLRELRGLEALVLEGNPFTQPTRQAPGESYRLGALAYCPVSLRTLDREAVSPEERVAIIQSARGPEIRRVRELQQLWGGCPEQEEPGGEQRGSAAAAPGAPGALLPSAAVGGLHVSYPKNNEAAAFSKITAFDCIESAHTSMRRLRVKGEALGGTDAAAGRAGAAQSGAPPPMAEDLAAVQIPGPAFHSQAPGLQAGAAECGSRRSSRTSIGSGCDSRCAGGGASGSISGGQGLACGVGVGGEEECLGPSGSEGGPEGLPDAFLEAVGRWRHGGTWQCGPVSESAAAGGAGEADAEAGRGSPGAPLAGARAGEASPEWEPISQQELEGSYLQAEGLLLGSRGAAHCGGGGRARAPGIEFDGRTLALTGAAVLYALGSPSYAAVSEVRLSHIDFQEIVGHLPSLAGMQHLSRLSLHANRIRSLPALDALLRLPRVTSLCVTGSPVNHAVLLRPYVAHRLPWVATFNGEAVADSEGAAAAAVFGPLDAELMEALAVPGQRAARAAAGLPAPPPPAERRRHGGSGGGARRTGGAGVGAGGAPAGGSGCFWLEAILAQLSCGAPLAAAADPASSEPAARGARLAEAWLADAARVQHGLGELRGTWGPGVVERCVEEGCRGHFTIPHA